MITIFTPTYNRKHIIGKLYESLVNQTSKEFVWLIVDDGSTDGTEELVKEWMKEDKIKIHFFYKENGGKHRAHNFGVKKCYTEWFICVDSDDFLTNNAVEIMYEELNTLNENYIGVVFPRYELSNGLPKKWFNNNIKMINISDIYILLDCVIETGIVIKTKYLKKILFPEISGENYIGEEILYNELQQYGSFKPVYKIVYCFEYLEDGLTKKTFELWKDCPLGMLCLLRSRYRVISLSKVSYVRKFKLKSKCIMNINALCLATNKKIMKETPNKMLSIVLLIPSILFKYVRYGR